VLKINKEHFLLSKLLFQTLAVHFIIDFRLFPVLTAGDLIYHGRGLTLNVFIRNFQQLGKHLNVFDFGNRAFIPNERSKYLHQGHCDEEIAFRLQMRS